MLINIDNSNFKSIKYSSRNDQSGLNAKFQNMYVLKSFIHQFLFIFLTRHRIALLLQISIAIVEYIIDFLFTDFLNIALNHNMKT